MRAFGRYRLIELIASGGMAEVWRAEAPGPEGFVKEVALKLVHGGRAGDATFVRMFVQEARLASRLTHANVVQVFDFDQVDGQYYLAMELVRGRSLRQVVERCREAGVRLGVARAVHVAAEVARALAYVHGVEDGGRRAGLVHRDVSPQNVLLSFEGEVKLADFGIARALGSADVTSPGGIQGKLAYMAPEQARGEAVDGRADVFALAVVLWELCAGRRLFARDGDAATLAALCGAEPVPPPSAWNEEVPPELDAVVLAALARDPGHRTASAESLASALAGLRLRLAEGPEDLDLRVLLRRLWPDGIGGGEGEREPTRPRAAAPACVPAAVPPLASTTPPIEQASSEAATRTLLARSPARARRGPRTIAAGAIAGALVAAAAAHVALRPSATAGIASAAAAREATVPAPASAPALAPAPADPPEPVAPPPSVPSPAPRPSTPAAAASTAAGPRPPARPAPRPRPAAQGTIAVRAAPWAFVTIDGKPAGETPVETTLPARRHRLVAHHPTLGGDAIVVDLGPGQRFVWRPNLVR